MGSFELNEQWVEGWGVAIPCPPQWEAIDWKENLPGQEWPRNINEWEDGSLDEDAWKKGLELQSIPSSHTWASPTMGDASRQWGLFLGISKSHPILKRTRILYEEPCLRHAISPSSP